MKKKIISAFLSVAMVASVLVGCGDKAADEKTFTPTPGGHAHTTDLIAQVNRFNEGFFADGGRIRGVPVTIGGSSYIPPLPMEFEVRERIEEILQSDSEDIDKAITLCLYTMKTQVFIDGNKRAAVIFANHFLIAHGQGFLVIPEAYVSEFKRLLVAFYEGEDAGIITAFLKENCWRTF